VTAPFDQSRSALVEATDGTFIGMIGELKPSVIRAFKLPSYTAAMTLDLDGLQTMFARASSHYTPLSRYPSITQDISLRVDTEVDYQALLACVRDALDAHEKTIMTESLSPLSIYQPRDNHDTKTITFRIKVTSQDRTLTDADASALLDGAADLADKKLNAERV
jgi:phenylalanyl-tRNA synthetase beta chain